MAWIPVAAWIVAALVAVVVLGYCAYEILWKTKRLRADIGELIRAGEQLQSLRGDLVAVQQRLAASNAGRESA